MKDKGFDCVEMKHRIQQAIIDEMAPLTIDERRRRTVETILADPLLSRLWKNAPRVPRLVEAASGGDGAA